LFDPWRWHTAAENLILVSGAGTAQTRDGQPMWEYDRRGDLHGDNDGKITSGGLSGTNSDWMDYTI